MKGLLLVGHEKVPHRFGLRTGDPGNIAGGAGNHGRPASQAWITGKNWGLPELQTSIFLRYGTPDWLEWGEGGKEGLCVFVGILRDFGTLMKTLSH